VRSEIVEFIKEYHNGDNPDAQPYDWPEQQPDQVHSFKETRSITCIRPLIACPPEDEPEYANTKHSYDCTNECDRKYIYAYTRMKRILKR
jgi:hypothetical protein